MRRSNKILLSIVGAGAFFLLCIVVALKVMVSTYVEKSENREGEVVSSDSEETVTKLYDFKDFDKIEISNNWKIDLKQGNEYKIKIVAKKRYEGNVQVSQNEKTLKLSVGGLVKLNNTGFHAEITMPALKEIDVSGSVDMNMSNFRGNNLDIDISGSGNINGKNCKYNKLNFESSGAAKLGFKEVVVRDCDFDMSGAGQAEVTMNGGKLTGEISGIGKFSYYGKVSQRNVDISGLGKVVKMD